MATTTHTRYTVTVRWTDKDGTVRFGINTLTSEKEANRVAAAAVTEYGHANVMRSAYTFDLPSAAA